MKPGWELAFRPGFSFQQKWTIPHAVIRAQKPLWRRTVFLTGACDPVPHLRNMPRNFANKGEFMSRAMRAVPQYFFCIISPDIALPYLHNSFSMLSGETVITPRQHHLFLLQMQIPQNQRNNPIFIIAVSFTNYWLSTNTMALYAL